MKATEPPREPQLFPLPDCIACGKAKWDVEEIVEVSDPVVLKCRHCLRRVAWDFGGGWREAS